MTFIPSSAWLQWCDDAQGPLTSSCTGAVREAALQGGPSPWSCCFLSFPLIWQILSFDTFRYKKQQSQRKVASKSWQREKHAATPAACLFVFAGVVHLVSWIESLACCGTQVQDLSSQQTRSHFFRLTTSSHAYKTNLYALVSHSTSHGCENDIYPPLLSRGCERLCSWVWNENMGATDVQLEGVWCRVPLPSTVWYRAVVRWTIKTGRSHHPEG